jgi:multiple sugar transport system permease protein
MIFNSLTIFILPWALGFFLFLIGPIVASLVLSFTSFDGLNLPVFIGLKNFETAFSDPIFWASLKVTFTFALISLPLMTILSITIAMLLNKKIIGVEVFKVIFYLPTIIPIVASSVLWTWIFKADNGILNKFLVNVFNFLDLEINPPLWLSDPQWALPALILMSVWSIGNPMIIYLAGLQNIPESLYEAAELDGANGFEKFIHVTIPMLMPTIFFNVTIGVIQVFQYFVPAFVMTSGGPQNATMFYTLYTYQLAFDDFRFGYASALSWILFLIIVASTYLVFRLKK